VPGLRAALELRERCQVLAAAQLTIEQDRIGLELMREREALRPADGENALEALLAADLELGARAVSLVFDDKEDSIAGLDRRAVVVGG
jgi:hypothetical protein